MCPEPQRTIKASTKVKLDEVFRSFRTKALLVLVKAFAIAIATTPVIAAITIFGKVANTSFPLLAAAMTALMINFKYMRPQMDKIGKEHAGRIKEILESDKTDS